MGVPNNLPRHENSNWFTTTHWTVVVSAKSSDERLALESLNNLCRTYWPPVHAYVRSRSGRPEDAEDLTQQFFARFIEKEYYKLACPERGRFRSFLLASAKRFLINERERAAAAKRGGGVAPVSLDRAQGEEGIPWVEPADERTGEHKYELDWAMTLLLRARDRLAAVYTAEGKERRFAMLEKFLPGEETTLTYADAARELGVAEGTVKSDVHRLKARYREILREEVAHTVSAESEIDEELRHLILVLGRPRR